ncbi:MAG TPA: phage holin family protein [Candidatus Paceibacterota bacterium]
MIHTLLHWVVAAIAIGVAAYLVPGVHVTLVGAFVLAVVLALINLFIRPVISILTLPLSILTLGLFSLVVNTLLVMLAARIVPGFSVAGFWSVFLFAILLALINTLFGVRFLRV